MRSLPEINIRPPAPILGSRDKTPLSECEVRQQTEETQPQLLPLKNRLRFPLILNEL